MKATELMIGDWVMYNPNVFIEDEYETAKKWFPTQIDSGEDIDLAIKGCYTPIPLTHEILEKNGWFYNKEDEKFFPQTWVGGGLMLQGADDCGYRIVVTSDYDDEDTNNTPFILLYVHELQHGLAAYNINPFRIIGKLEKRAYIDEEKIYIRLLLESTSKRNADFQERCFKNFCECMERLYSFPFFFSTSIILCGGQTKRDWHTVYDFKNPLPPIIELYASAPKKRNPLWKICPYLYRKYITRKLETSELAMRKDLLLMIDFI